MEYVTAFDVSQSGYKYWWVVIVGLLIIGAGLYVLQNKKGPYVYQHKKYPWTKKQDYLGWVGLWSVLTLFIFIPTYCAHVSLRNDLLEGRCKVAEGIVSGFLPEEEFGPKHEEFLVNGIKFIYTRNAFRAGFNTSRVYNVPIGNGLKVRIHYRPGPNNSIAKLEIAR